MDVVCEVDSNGVGGKDGLWAVDAPNTAWCI